jgi:N-acylneuraminate cytidylyltransferase
MKTYAIIPARGGSKRVPKKNIRVFNGKPLIQWTITNLLNYDIFDEIIISTDDKETSNYCKLFDVKVLDNRPKELSDDQTPTLPVIKYVIENNLDYVESQDQIVCIYPGSILLQRIDLVEAQKLFLLNRNNFVIAATNYSHPIQRSFRINEKNEVKDFNVFSLNQRTQDLNTHYHDAGQFYWGNKQLWTSSDGILSNCSAITIPNWRIQDIDSLEDWESAQLMHNILLNRET